MKIRLFFTSLIGWFLTSFIVVFSFFEINLVKISPYFLLLIPIAFIDFVVAIIYAKYSNEIIQYDYKNNSLPGSGVPLIPFFEKAPNWILVIVFLSFILTIIFFSKIFNTENVSSKDLVRGLFSMSMLLYSLAILIYKRLLEWELK